MDKQFFKKIFLTLAVVVIGGGITINQKPEMFAFMPQEVVQFLAPNYKKSEPKQVVAVKSAIKPKAITLPAWGNIQPETQFSDYAPGEMRGGIRLAGQQVEEKTFDGVIEAETRARVLQRVGDQYQVSYNGFTVWVPLASVKLTGK